MDVQQPLQLLAGLSAQQFMRRYWQKKPLLVRQAVPGFRSKLERRALFALAGRDDVESRLVTAGEAPGRAAWKLRHGPFGARALPPLKRPGWTLLVQGVDMHVAPVRQLLDRFRFIPEARLDDVMVSYASDGGGVGPHFDSYDVFLFQAQGRRRWSYGRQKDLSLHEDVPLKLLRNFEPEHEVVLEPGDMLYLPPRYAHDGVAVGECMTWSVGFRAPGAGTLAGELLQRLAQDAADSETARMYRDPGQVALVRPAFVPQALSDFASKAVQQALAQPLGLERALGEYLTEPKASVWFDGQAGRDQDDCVRLDARTRMMYDDNHVFINGESYRARGRDARLMRELADARWLSHTALVRASASARGLLAEWCAAGWIHGL